MASIRRVRAKACTGIPRRVAWLIRACRSWPLTMPLRPDAILDRASSLTSRGLVRLVAGTRISPNITPLPLAWRILRLTLLPRTATLAWHCRVRANACTCIPPTASSLRLACRIGPLTMRLPPNRTMAWAGSLVGGRRVRANACTRIPPSIAPLRLASRIGPLVLRLLPNTTSAWAGSSAWSRLVRMNACARVPRWPIAYRALPLTMRVTANALRGPATALT